MRPVSATPASAGADIAALPALVGSFTVAVRVFVAGVHKPRAPATNATEAEVMPSQSIHQR